MEWGEGHLIKLIPEPIGKNQSGFLRGHDDETRLPKPG
jgi:hypothetical protein